MHQIMNTFQICKKNKIVYVLHVLIRVLPLTSNINKMADAMANYPEGGIHEFTFMLLMAKTEKK